MKKILKVLAHSLLGASMLVGAATATNAQELKKVKIAHGNPVMIPILFELYLPLAMGWWRDDGYDVEVMFSQGSSAAVQSMIGGSGDIGVVNTTPWLAADAKGLADIRMIAAKLSTSWRILTTPESGITKPEDLKGKMIGQAVAGSGGVMYLNSILGKHGMDPQRDVRQAVIGLGPQAYEAVNSGRVDASMTFMSEIANYKVLGNQAVVFYDDAWLDFLDYGMVASSDIIAKDPKLVESMARGVAKALVFAKANPECVAKIYRKDWAGNRTTSLEQDTELMRLNSEESLIAFERGGGELYARVWPEGLDKLQHFLLENKQIPNTVDVAKMMPDDPDFFKKINDFDKEAVIAQAKECPGY